MGNFPLYEPDGTFKEHMPFDESVFGDTVREVLLRTAVLRHEANRRQGDACTKERSEIKGSMKKPWRQKGLGRARAGSRKSPIWRSGGTTFGPKPRSYRSKMNRKARGVAMRSALLSKFLDREILLIEKFEFEAPKTTQAAGILANIGIHGRVLVGLETADETVWKSMRNIPGVVVRPAIDINAYDLLRQKTVLLTLGALEFLKGKFSPEEGKEK
jgi:large subunit ribosomal protein L4